MHHDGSYPRTCTPFHIRSMHFSEISSHSWLLQKPSGMHRWPNRMPLILGWNYVFIGVAEGLIWLQNNSPPCTQTKEKVKWVTLPKSRFEETRSYPLIGTRTARSKAKIETWLWKGKICLLLSSVSACFVSSIALLHSPKYFTKVSKRHICLHISFWKWLLREAQPTGGMSFKFASIPQLRIAICFNLITLMKAAQLRADFTDHSWFTVNCSMSPFITRLCSV